MIYQELVAASVDEGQAVNFRHVREIVDFAAKMKLPSIYEFREGPEQGGLMSYGADLGELFGRAASPNHALNTDARRRGFAPCRVAG